MKHIHMGGNVERRMQNAERRSTRSAHRLFQRVMPWFAFLLLTSSFVLPSIALAQVDPGLAEFGRVTTLAQDDIRIIIARIIRTGLGLLGVVAVLIVLYGGFLWMTSEGESDKMEDAKRVLTNGVIGLAIVLASFAIAQFVLSRLLAATGDGGTGGPRVPGVVFPGNLTGALGAGPIVSHYPERDAVDIPPNIRIFVTFREPLDASSLIADTNGNGTRGTSGVGTGFDNNFDLALPTAIQVAKAGANVDWSNISDPDEAAKLVPVAATLTTDGKTIALTPVATTGTGDTRRVTATASGSAQRQFLDGSAREHVAYIVRLTSVIENNRSESIFTGAWRDGYAWAFTVSADADLIPPKIDNVIPSPGATEPRNVLVQVNFNEAMDPTVTSGVHRPTTSTFNFLGVENAATAARVSGEWTIGNGYRTTEFQTFDACGLNSCGGTVYCLPGGAALRAFVEAAPVEAGTTFGLPFSGVMDAAGNSLSGDGDGDTEGPSTPRYDLAAKTDDGTSDSVEWQFTTTNTIDLTPPTIDEIVHVQRNADATRSVYDVDAPLSAVTNASDAENVSLEQPIEARFSKRMSVTTTQAFTLEDVTGGVSCNPSDPNSTGCLWYSTRISHEDSNGDAVVDKSRATVVHQTLRPPPESGAPPEYRVRVDATARDVYQNCFFEPVGVRGGEKCVGAPGSETCEEL